MSNRLAILKLLAADPATIADLVDVIRWPERKVRDTIGDLRTNALVQSGRDDVTGKPMYSITKASRAWLEGKGAGTKPQAVRSFSETLNQLPAFKAVKESSKTQAESGDITSAAAHRSTSLASSIPGEGAAVVEPLKPEELPAAARSDEIPDDDSDPHAFPRSRGLVMSVSTDGQMTVARRHGSGIVLTATETRDIFEFLTDTMRVWGKAE